jgi:integrase/recombinase XerD
VAKILRDGGYTYDQSKHLIAEARKEVGLTPPKRKKGAWTA